MQILVTGGAGFIGSHLVERLLTDGHDVVIVDDLSTGSMDNVAALRDRERLTLVLQPLEDLASVDHLLQDIDLVFHLAAAVGVRLVVDSPLRTLRTNVHATELLLAAAARRGCPVVLTSSSEVYGKSTQIPFREDDDIVLGPTSRSRWSYALSKATDELIALAYWHERQLPTIVTRLFNTVGPRQTGRYGMVLPSFVQRALDGEPLQVYGDGQQSRCFCHVLDTVEALVRLSRCEAAYGRVVNIGGTVETSVAELARRVVERTGSPSPIELLAYERAYGPGFEDMRRRVPDTTRLHQLTGWRPTRDLDDIIDDVIAERRARPGQDKT